MAAPTPYGAVEADAGGCHLISENYAYALQLILGFAALAGLVVRLVVSQVVNLVCLLISSFFSVDSSPLCILVPGWYLWY